MKTATRLLTLDDALQMGSRETSVNYRRHINARMATLMELVGFTVRFTRACGPHLWDEQGNRYLDCLCGYGALSLGHNHPRIIAALDRLRTMPNLVEGLDSLAAALAHNLAVLAPGALERAYFANSGAEVVDAAIKLARSATGRSKLVACHNGFHGRTLGALSVTDRREYSSPFTPLLPDVGFVPFGDAEKLEQALRRRDVAGFLVEPLQGEGGFVVPPPSYLAEVRNLCTRYGTLFIADEVQTGLGRTGALFAVDHDDVVPDVLLLGKALGGGLMPLSAVLTTDAIARAARVGTVYSPFHTATFGGNPHSTVAGIETLAVIEEEDLVSRAAAAGEYLVQRLREVQRRQALIASVRGRGLMVGIELAEPLRGMGTILTGGIVNRLSRSYFSGEIMTRLMTQHRIISAFTLNDPNVLRLQPPLNVSLTDLDEVVCAVERTLEDCRTFLHVAVGSRQRLVRAIMS